MIFSLRKGWRFIRFFVLLCILAFLLYSAFERLSSWVTPIQHYKIPEGNAVKVAGTSIAEEPEGGFWERLRFFYWYGE
ncbi:DUF4227 family protein [Paenibacillus zeirhizosphaerae]|uniref:DUF4227 family protein n=1 Tax=Paenibacillus zeirhizosphaerae TaxID=2987519 RepID=UPI0035216F8C